MPRCRQVSHAALCQYTDRSCQCSLLYEGQVRACWGGGGQRQRGEGKSPATSVFTLSPCLSSAVPFPLSPLGSLPRSLPPQRNPASPLGSELFEGDPELHRCRSPPSLQLPSAPAPRPSGGLDPAQPRAAVLQIQARARRSRRGPRRPSHGAAERRRWEAARLAQDGLGHIHVQQT